MDNNDWLENDNYMYPMPMMNMPTENMEMYNMPMENMPMMNMCKGYMPMMNMCGGCMPIMKAQKGCKSKKEHDEDEELKKMYPKIYYKMYPMIKSHCDMMEAKHGKMYCPKKDEIDRICEDICDKCEKCDNDDDDKDDDDMKRRSHYGRRPFIRDLSRILLIRELFGRRRRRRRRRRNDDYYDHYDHDHDYNDYDYYDHSHRE